MVEKGEREMVKERKNRRRLVGGANAVLIAVAAVTIAVLLNAVASQVFWRFDLTANQIYTLSPSSLDAVGNLEEHVEVRAYISPNMPPPYHNLIQQVDELLMEYAAASDGMFSYRIVSPEDDQDVAETARGYGIEQVAIGQETETEVSYRAVYKGVAFMQEDRVEVIDDLRTGGPVGIHNFEYEFTRALLNLQRQEPRRVAILSGFGGPAGYPEFVTALEVIFEQMYGNLLTIEAVDLGVESEVSEDYDALVILNIDRDLGEDALFAIDQFVQGGGNIGWYQSGAVIDEEFQREFFEEMQRQGIRQAIPQMRKQFDSDLIDYFAALGIVFNSDAVLDRQRALARGVIMTEHGPARVSHPGTFAITEIDHELSFARYFSTLALPVPSSITINASAFGPGVEVFEVLRTEETSLRRPRPPAQPIYEVLVDAEPGEEPGPFSVAVALQGELASYYRDRPLPPGRSEVDVVSEPQPSRVLVVGSGDFIGEFPDAGYDGQLSALGAQFFLSSVEWLAQESELAEIRGKAMPRMISEVPRKAQRSIQFINIAVVPTLFACIGMFMMVRRRKRKEAFGEYGKSDDDTPVSR